MEDKVAFQEEIEVTEEIAAAVVQARVFRDPTHKYLGIRVDLAHYQGDCFDLAFKVAKLLPEEHTWGGPWEKVSWQREVELGVGGDQPFPAHSPGRHAVVFIRRSNLHVVSGGADTSDRSEP